MPKRKPKFHEALFTVVVLCIVIFLFVLAIFDLMVGVSNDAVNFLNSAIGAKAETAACQARPCRQEEGAVEKNGLHRCDRRAGMAYTHITPGWEIEMSAHCYSDKNADRVAELIQLPREELAAMEEASVAKEKTIFSKCSEIETEWKKQAAETAAVRAALAAR